MIRLHGNTPRFKSASRLNAYTDGAVKQSVCHIVGVQFRLHSDKAIIEARATQGRKIRMQYNYSFEAASPLFMLLIFVHFMVVWQFPTEKTRVFRALLIVCIGESAFNILSSIGLANAGVVRRS